MSTGELSVLNCGAGDIRINFDKNDPMEVERAKRIIQDMLTRGYILFVEVKGKLRKVTRFDAKKECYIVADGPLYAGDSTEGDNQDAGEGKATAKKTPASKKKKTKKVAMRSAKATGIAPTAGG